MSESLKIGIVLLAAGASSRLGQPKQLIQFRGKNLLQHTIDTANELEFESSILIVGANADQVLSKVTINSFQSFTNENWEQGMASSLRLGIKKSLISVPDLNAILISVSDQPFVSKELLQEMIQLYRSESSIVVCEYDNVKGVPVLFGSKYFNELLMLNGDQGAQKIIKDHEKMQSIVMFDHGNFDIDTPEDLERLNKWKN
ncbi:nucleotidyltransferase family protein [Ekhidna sp.]|uniref:nucleotidyltransferase family protein n=1 Tax=Ekhidna sp. TaxID=2608089 RepID=UPI0032987077